jgi:hypothetical protein
MFMRGLSHRGARLEARKTKPAVVVSGYSEQEYEIAIADLIAKGDATERDLFV